MRGHGPQGHPGLTDVTVPSGPRGKPPDSENWATMKNVASGEGSSFPTLQMRKLRQMSDCPSFQAAEFVPLSALRSNQNLEVTVCAKVRLLEATSVVSGPRLRSPAFRRLKPACFPGKCGSADLRVHHLRADLRRAPHWGSTSVRVPGSKDRSSSQTFLPVPCGLSVESHVALHCDNVCVPLTLTAKPRAPRCVLMALGDVIGVV